MITFSVCIFLFSSTPELLRPSSGNSHCPGLQSKVRAWAGKDSKAGMEAGKWAGAWRDETISTLELMRNPSLPRIIWPPLSSEQPPPIPVFGTHKKQWETCKDIEWIWKIQMIQLQGWFGAVPQLNSWNVMCQGLEPVSRCSTPSLSSVLGVHITSQPSC